MSSVELRRFSSCILPDYPGLIPHISLHACRTDISGKKSKSGRLKEFPVKFVPMALLQLVHKVSCFISF